MTTDNRARAEREVDGANEGRYLLRDTRSAYVDLLTAAYDAHDQAVAQAREDALNDALAAIADLRCHYTRGEIAQGLAIAQRKVRQLPDALQPSLAAERQAVIGPTLPGDQVKAIADYLNDVLTAFQREPGALVNIEAAASYMLVSARQTPSAKAQAAVIEAALACSGFEPSISALLRAVDDYRRAVDQLQKRGG